MAEIARTRVALEWDHGGPGVNTFYWTPGIGSDFDGVLEDFRQELADLYSAIDGYMVSSLTWTVGLDTDIIDVATGNIIDALTASEPQTGSGGNTGEAVSRAQQFYVRYLTDQWEDGRRLAGGNFFGPVGNDVVSGDSLVTPGDRVIIEGAFSALTSFTGPILAVYSRPRPGHAGSYGNVRSVRLKSSLGTLKSRRD